MTARYRKRLKGGQRGCRANIRRQGEKIDRERKKEEKVSRIRKNKTHKYPHEGEDDGEAGNEDEEDEAVSQGSVALQAGSSTPKRIDNCTVRWGTQLSIVYSFTAAHKLHVLTGLQLTSGQTLVVR
jgi:hypothetical protein